MLLNRPVGDFPCALEVTEPLLKAVTLSLLCLGFTFP